MNPTRVRIESFGCSTNLADSEVLAGCLNQAGFELTESIHQADVIIYNCCSVKGPTENRMIEIIKRAPLEKKVVVTGCLPLTSFDRLQKALRFDGVVGPAAGSEIINVVKRVMRGERAVSLERALVAKPPLCLPRVRRSRIVSLIPLGYGCLGSCAYCCVVLARGRLRSYAVEEIAEKVKCDLASGAREFWLTSQDTACYGRDLDTNLAAMLKSVCTVPGDFSVRVGMMTPNLAMDILDQLVEAYKDEKVFKFLHLPVQSGNDDVLRMMNRCYTVQEFKNIVGAFRDAFPDITLATDVICGFPGETKKAFDHTLQLIEEVEPDVVNVSKFFARPRTAAAAMIEGVVAQDEIKRRSGAAACLVKQTSLQRNEKWMGWKGEILIDEAGKIPGSWIGRNFAYKPVTVKDNADLFGKTVKVKVVDAFSTHLEGTIVD